MAPNIGYGRLGTETEKKPLIGTGGIQNPLIGGVGTGTGFYDKYKKKDPIKPPEAIETDLTKAPSYGEPGYGELGGGNINEIPGANPTDLPPLISKLKRPKLEGIPTTQTGEFSPDKVQLLNPIEEVRFQQQHIQPPQLPTIIQDIPDTPFKTRYAQETIKPPTVVGINPDVFTRQSAVYTKPTDPKVTDVIPPADQAKTGTPADQLTEQMRLRMEKENMLNMDQNRRLTHDRAVREGFAPGTAQYEAMMRQSETTASQQNIAATNKFREFATQREDELKRDEMRDFEMFNKYVESDVGQSAIAGIAAAGGDWKAALGQMYTTDDQGRRVLKPEFKDMSQVERTRSSLDIAANGMTTNPDNVEGETPLGWGPAEQKSWVDNKMNQIIEQGVSGTDITEKQTKEIEARENRIDKALESGDYSKMLESDWVDMPSSKKADIKADALNTTEANNTGDDWSDLDNIDDDQATRIWKRENEMARSDPGDSITYKGKTYIITEPAVIVGESGNNRRIHTKGIDINTGKEVTIKESSRFEPKSGFNPFD